MILFTQYAFSCVEGDDAFLSQYPNNPKISVNLYGELLYIHVELLLYMHGVFLYM